MISIQRSVATRAGRGAKTLSSTAMRLDLIEFPADDLARARRFWETLLDVSLDERKEGEGQGLQTRAARPSLGLHERGRGPGDRFSLPHFRVPDLAQALERLVELGGSVVHPGERWAICRDSEGSPFALAAECPPDDARTSS
jgi:predicted enzyme related to lactoylglutathione lyase